MQNKKTYQPKSIETNIYNQWEQQGCFKHDKNAVTNNYCIMLPPPNVTGSLHMGHAFQDTIMDTLIRYHKMQGKNTLWQVGTDHAGIATQMVVERKLEQEQEKTRYDLGREEFVKQVWHWKEECGDNITNQMRRLGVAANWDRTKFTMDAGLSKAVVTAFVQLYNDKLIYKGKRLVNWDADLGTAISDLEVNNIEKQGSMWFIKYPLVNKTTIDGLDYLLVGTTRPETLLGDSAIAVNPEDPRFKDLIGSKVKLPLTNRELPIIGDKHADMDKGTGCVKITPAHDFNDYEVGKRHNLPLYNIFSKQAAILESIQEFSFTDSKFSNSFKAPTDYAGLDRFAARKKIIADLQAQDLLAEIKTQITMIPHGDRSNSVIEPMLMDQWYVAVKSLAKNAQDAVNNGDIEFIPNQYKNMYNAWMNDINDWCISRQLWWGHRIPAWYDDHGQVYVGESEEAVRAAHNLPSSTKLTQDEDVLDTWFSSSLWTFATLGWPDATEELKQFHPTDVLVTGFDIIFFWVARMIMMSLYFVKDANGKPQIPFKKVYITGLIRDESGLKMSKSKGNVIDPLDMIDGIKLEDLITKRTSNLMQPKLKEKIKKQTEKNFPDGIIEHGTDALRFTLTSLASTGRDINWDMKRLEGYRNFCNKLFQATNYVILSTKTDANYDSYNFQPTATALTITDQWILSKLQNTIIATTDAIDNYRFDLAANTLYDFTWNEYCSWYLEFSKITLKSEDAAAAQTTKNTLIYVLEQILRLIHPIMPYLTEHLWQELKEFNTFAADFIMQTSYPTTQQHLINATVEQDMDFIQQVIIAVRNIRAQYNIAFTKPLTLNIKNIGTKKQLIEDNLNIIQSLVKINEINFIEASTNIVAAKQIVAETELLIPMAEFLDVELEITRINKKILKLEQEQKVLQGKLSNEKFVQKAPKELVEQEKLKLSTATKNIESLQEQIATLKSI